MHWNQLIVLCLFKEDEQLSQLRADGKAELSAARKGDVSGKCHRRGQLVHEILGCREKYEKVAKKGVTRAGRHLGTKSRYLGNVWWQGGCKHKHWHA